MGRGRSPTTRRRSRSPSQDSNDDELSLEHEEEEEEEEKDFFSIASLVIFIKCVLFSIIVTVSILSFTNFAEVSHILKEILSASGPQVVQRNVPGNTPMHNTDDAEIYIITVPPQCHQSGHQNRNECKNLLSAEMKEAYHKDGVIALRGILSPQEIELLHQSSLKLLGIDTSTSQGFNMDEGPIKVSRASSSGKQFFKTQHHAIFESEMEGFSSVGLKSLLPQVAAELMGMNESQSQSQPLQENSKRSESLRLLRDVFMAKDQDPYICGWHVDDTGFWPTPFDAEGVNAWIAIDSIPISTGGGFALSIGSHTADWRFKAYELTGSTYTLPEHGYVDAEDMFNKRGVGTCNIKNADPDINRKMEDAKRVYDVQRGDVILHTRWLFHRTVPIDRKRAKELNKKREKVLYRRYSVRYTPGSATLARGYGTELSTLYNSSFGGKTLDLVNAVDGPWYPKCWPDVDASEIESMDSVKEKMIFAAEIKKKVMKEMRPYLKEIGLRENKKVLNTARNLNGGPPKRERGGGTSKIMELKNKGEL